MQVSPIPGVNFGIIRLMAGFGADCSVVPFPEMLLDGAVQ